MNGKGKIHFKSFEDSSRIFISPGVSRTREVLLKQHSLESRQKDAAKQASIQQLTELKKDPDMYKKLIDTVMETVKTQTPALTYEFNFSIQYNTFFGERIVATGEPEFLGNWDPLKGLELEWSTGSFWKANILLGEGVVKDFEYKYVCIKKNEILWEKGDNRSLKIAEGAKNKTQILFNKDDYWQD